MQNHNPLLAGIALTVALAAMAGCAQPMVKIRVSGEKMCQAHRGTYDPAAKTCTYPQQTLSARDYCLASPGGYWDDAAGFCEFGIQ